MNHNFISVMGLFCCSHSGWVGNVEGWKDLERTVFKWGAVLGEAGSSWAFYFYIALN